MDSSKVYLLLFYFSAAVFIIAGSMRLMYPQQREREWKDIYPFLPEWSGLIVAFSEIVLGVLLLTSFRMYAIYVLVIGMIGYMVLIMVRHSNYILQTFTDISTFQLHAVSMVLHITYIIILIYIALAYYSTHS